MEKKNLKVLITGVSGGVGKLLTREFQNSRFDVIGTDLPREEELPEEFVTSLAGYYAFDLTRTGEIPTLVESVFSDHPDISILVNNAGILDFRYFHEYTEEELLHVYQVNLIAAILMVRACMPYFERKKYGRIINISSSSSFRGFETGTLYTSSKVGLNLFTEAFSKELDIRKRSTPFDITINTVCPGRIATEEYLRENPGVDPRSLLSHEKVFHHILRFIQGDINGEIRPIFPGKLKREILMKEIRRFL